MIKERMLVAFLFLMAMPSFSFGNQDIKRPNVSGQFYDADPKKLAGEIDSLFTLAATAPSDKKIDIVISPHAGYIYSGHVAAYGYKAVRDNAYKTIIIIGPSHFYDFEGASVWAKGGFETPLGKIEVDEPFCASLLALNGKLKFVPDAFEREHSVEVQIPFLQKTFKGFKIVPILMGEVRFEDCQSIASTLKEIIGARHDVLIVVSTDMSHYHSDKIAREMDYHTLVAIKKLDVENLWNQCLLRKMELCGFSAVTTALLYARQRNIQDIDVLKYANSGDVTSDKSRVVGYSSIIFFEEKNPKTQNAQQDVKEKKESAVLPLSGGQKKRLLEIARKTIFAYIGQGVIPQWSETDPRLSEKEGAFVTIRKKGQLRGCIGRIIGDQPLYLTVRDMAVAVATQDTRFTPVKQDELKDIDIEVSVLSKPWRITNTDEIKLGVHGVIITGDEFHRGLFLPQVAAEQGWNKEEFLSNLCAHKAGLPADAWKNPNTSIEIFTADVFSENDLK